MKNICLTLFILTITAISSLAEVTVRDYTFIGGDPKSKSQYMQQKYKFWGSGKFPKEKIFKAKLIVIANNKKTFAFWIPGKIQDKKWIIALGMAAPSKANWYNNGFFRVRSGKFDTDKAPAKVDNISQGSSVRQGNC